MIGGNEMSITDPRVLNEFIRKILPYLCVKRRSKNPRRKLLKYLTFVFHPFSLMMHTLAFYNLFVLLRESSFIILDDSKTRLSSSVSVIISLSIWCTCRARGTSIHLLLRKWHSHFSRNKNKIKTSNCTREKILFFFLFVNIIGPSVFAVSYSLNVDVNIFTNFWFLGNSIQDIGFRERVAIFVCVFVYINEQMFFPGIFLFLFCVLCLHLGNELDELKKNLKRKQLWLSYVSKYSEKHRDILVQVENHEKVLSLPIFLLLSFFITVGYTGFALGFSRFDVPQNLFLFEAFMYIHISVVGILSITYTASRIPMQLQEIQDICLSAYENTIQNHTISMTATPKQQLMLLKMVCKRPVRYLSAWGIFNLDRKLGLTSFGVLLTYGILIMQMKRAQDKFV